MKIIKFLFVAAVTASLTACGGGGSMPKFGNNEFPVETVGANSASLQSTYPATIKGIQDVEVRPKVSGFITRVYVHEGQVVKPVSRFFQSIVKLIRLQFARHRPVSIRPVHS